MPTCVKKRASRNAPFPYPMKLNPLRRKPGWQSRDPAERARAIADAPLAEIGPRLVEFARGDESPEVRRAALRRIDDLSLLADLANGMLYVRGVNDTPALQAAARARGGYATILPTTGAAGCAFDRWGYQPEGIELMRGLRQRWGAGGLLNPGAFLL